MRRGHRASAWPRGSRWRPSSRRPTWWSASS